MRTALLSTLLVVFLPLLGVLIAGQPIGRYLEFPPRTIYIDHPQYSARAFAANLVIILGGIALWLFFPTTEIPREPAGTRPLLRTRFPWWGKAGLLLALFTWFLAWNRFRWVGALQAHLFTPLWVGYILVVNAWTFARSGRSMLTHEPGYFWRLVATSAVFWWMFEYLNRFVQNWYYLGLVSYGPAEYFVYATLPFSTVLPAVLGTQELLETIPGFAEHFRHRRPVPVAAPRLVGGLILCVFGGALALIGVFPQILYSFLWTAPLFIFLSLQTLAGKPHLFTEVASGDWSRFSSSALAALICGFFWEMWNYGSLARWIYMVPFVDRWHVFEMPILGFAGYLPFGLECLMVGDLVRRTMKDSTGKN